MLTNNFKNIEPKITLIPSDIYMGPAGPALHDSLWNLDHYFVYGKFIMNNPIIHVRIDNDFLITLRARYASEIFKILRILCYHCNFPPLNCPCSDYQMRTGEWALRGPWNEDVYLDVSRYGRRQRFITATYEGSVLQGAIISRPRRQFGYGLYHFRVVLDGFLIVTLRVNNKSEIHHILDMLCYECYQMAHKCNCSVFHKRHGAWQLEFSRKGNVDLCTAYYFELQGDDSEEELPDAPPNPRNGWGGVYAWTRDVHNYYFEFRYLVDCIGTFPMRIVADFVGYLSTRSDIIHVIDVMELEEPSRSSRRCRETVLQGSITTHSVEDILTIDSPYYLGVKLLEDLATLVYYMRQSRSFEDVGMAITSFVRSVTGQSVAVLVARLTEIVYAELAAYFLLQDSTTWEGQFTELFEHYRDVKNSIFATKVLKVLNTTVFSVILHKMDIEPDGDLIRRIESKHLRPSMLNCLTFLDATAELVTFCLRQGRQYYITKDINVFFMDRESLSEWYMRSKQLEENFKFLSNPEAVGIKIHDYLAELDTAVKDGQSICKYMKHSTLEFRLVSTRLMRLESMNKEYLTICAAQSLRRQPLGIVLYGKPGVGKSHVLETLYHYHSKVRGLDPSPGFKFQFNSDEDFMTNYKSYMHCIVIDDVAQHKPDKVQGIDKSLGMCIKLINNQPTCPPQAALEDKGKTPVLSELVIATTNTLDLAIPHYFTKSYAVMRRFKVHIEMVVKERYKAASGGIDGDIDDVYEDKWDFVIRRPREQDAMVGKFVETQTLTSFKELFDFLKPIIEQHHREQDNFLRSANNFRKVELCCACHLPESLCERMGECEIHQLMDEMITRVQGDRPIAPDIEFNQDFVGEDIIGEDNANVVAPWRLKPLMEVGNRRFLTEAMARKFVLFVTRDDRENRNLERVAEEYAYIHYPVMMRCGYPDSEILRDFEIFKAWRYNQDDCIRFMDSLDNSVSQPRWRIWLTKYFMYCYFEFLVFRYAIDTMMSFSITGRFIIWIFGNIVRTQRQRQRFMGMVGTRIDESLGGMHPLVKVACLWSVVSTVGMFFTLFTRARSVPEEDRIFTDLDEAKKQWKNAEKKYEEKARMYKNALEQLEKQSSSTQGLLQEIGTVPVAAEGDSKTNIWVGTEKKVTTLDFCSERATTAEALQRSLNQSCVRVDLTWYVDGTIKQYKARAMILSNDCVLVNDHGVPNVPFMLRILWSSVRGNIYTQVECAIKPEQIFRIANRDISIINTKSLPPMVSNFTRNFSRSSFEGKYDGYYMVRRDDGSFIKHPVYGVSKIGFNDTIGGNKYNCVTFRGTVKEPTLDGYCGSPLILETGYGPIVVGFHFMFRHCDHVVYASALFVEDFEFITTGVQGTCVNIEPYKIVDRHKSFLDFHEGGNITYMGEIDYRVRYKTSVKPTEIRDQLVLMPEHDDFRFEDTHSKPLMHNYIPQQRALADYLQPSFGIDEVRMQKCTDVLFANIMSNLPKEELELIQVCTYGVAVNGMPGMAYVDSMKRSTSMGFPWHMTKRAFLREHVTEAWPEGVLFTPDIEHRIENNLQKYMRGERCHPTFSTNLKDEVVKEAKYQLGKTRTYFSCPGDYLVIMRIFFLGFSRVVQRNWKVFHCVIGVNCHSTQWQEVFTRLTKFGQDRMIAGDFASFDKKFHMCFSRWTFDVIKRVCVASGNFEGLEHVLDALGADFLHPSVNFFGMLVVLLGGEVSGHQITTIFNCFCSTLYLMYCYDEFYDVSDFFSYVEMFVLGDDNIQNVSIERPLYNHTSIKGVLTCLGVGYTMAEKESASRPYINIYESTFLKRGFRYSKEMGTHVGPLDRDSIVKMLTYQVMSKTCSPSEQLAQAMVSSGMEAFYHGKEFFDYIEGCLQTLRKSDALVYAEREFPRLTWNENVARFLKASNAAGDICRNQICNSDSSYCKDCSHSSLQSLRMDYQILPTRAFLEVPFQGRNWLVFKSEDTGLKCELTSLPDKIQLAENNTSSSSGSLLEMKDLNNKAPVDMDERTTGDTQEENMYFVHEDKNAPMDLTTVHDPTADMQLIQADLRTFLSRPAKIGAYNWTIGAANGILATYYPWSLYFNVPTVNNKLKSFKYLRCNLHVKFVINASPFYYGAIGAFYEPLALDLDDKTGLWAGSTVGQQVLLSQRNHVWIDPQSTSTEEMVLPFLYYFNFVDTAYNLFFTNLGKINLVQYAGLQSANGVAAGAVTVNVYAWATEVELAGTTSQLILQGRTEYTGNGQISGPASTVASIANKLRNVPILGPFATATEVVSGAVSDVASFFGFTNVPVIEDVKPMKSLPFHTLASSTISEPINKLSLQPKQETSVGMYHGDPTADPLVISNFVQKESFLAGAQWQTTNVEDDIIFTAAVTPDLFEYAATPQAWYPTPMAYMSSFFQYWSGDIIFRFKIVKSKYHRGRINICWDVGAANANQMPVVGNPSVFNVVVDLDGEDDVEIRVPYTQAAPFLSTTYWNTGVFWSNGPAPGFVGYGNGFIQIRVLNVLSAPVSTSAVTILTFVRGADNLEFAGPRNMQRDKTLLLLQGEVITLNRTAPQSGDKYKENFGERIVSIRELLHRQSKAADQIIPKNVDWAGNQMIYTFPIQRLPRCYGYHENGWETGAGTIVPASNFPINYVRNHPLNWITACFVGYKGSTNYNFNAIHQRGNVNQASGHLSVSRRTDIVNQTIVPRSYSTSETNSTSQLMKNYNTQALIDNQGAGGMALTNQYTQAGLAVNLPYYSRSKFLVANLQRTYPSSYPTQWEVEQDCFEVTYKRSITTSGTTDANVTIDIFAGSGPDFDVIYFLNCPAIFQLTPPTALTTG